MKFDLPAPKLPSRKAAFDTPLATAERNSLTAATNEVSSCGVTT